ncbi:hypothetical protein NPIL_337101 [Nephila pilipes]|uniref:Uncharacterized protein n=1 Tax=Nephila pilipes TaxID=299642 RepID=A0A8X6QEE1_NEPPI|nr:hypothetical protein NPIL_337101 [Nephila pilipes]
MRECKRRCVSNGAVERTKGSSSRSQPLSCWLFTSQVGSSQRPRLSDSRLCVKCVGKQIAFTLGRNPKGGVVATNVQLTRASAFNMPFGRQGSK